MKKFLFEARLTHQLVDICGTEYFVLNQKIAFSISRAD